MTALLCVHTELALRFSKSRLMSRNRVKFRCYKIVTIYDHNDH